MRRMLETLSLPVMLVGLDGTIRWIGGSSERDFGVSPESVEGRNVLDFLPPDQIESAINSMSELGRADEIGIGVPVPYEILRTDGTRTWHQVGAVPLGDDPDVEGLTFYYIPWDSHHHLDQFMAALLADEPLPAVLEHLARSIAFGLEAVGVAVHHDPRSGGARAAAAGVPAALLELVDAPWTSVASTGEPLHLSVDDLPSEVHDVARGSGIEGVWVIPVDLPPGEPRAVVTIWRSASSAPVNAHQFAITRSLRYVELALIRHAEHVQLAHMATHDTLTGVATRAVFSQRLAEALVGPAPTVVLFCDLDGFKEVNDTHGHAAGDAVLAQVAQRFRTAMRPGDMLARMGGDEFTVLLRGDETSARAVAERMLEALLDPIDVVDAKVQISVSIGASVSSPGVSSDRLLRAADSAAYAAKRAGGQRLVVARPGDQGTLGV
jgi:diguanylate cyclase (GGDEF)-like protein/PAS domain S-box-containing protein